MVCIQPKNHHDYFRLRNGNVTSSLHITLANIPESELTYTEQEAREIVTKKPMYEIR